MKKLLVCFMISMVLFSCGEDPVEPEKEKTGPVSDVIINELDGSREFVELYNTGDLKVNLEGCKVRRMRVADGQEDEQTLWTGQKDEFIAPGEYLCLRYEEGKEDQKGYLKRDFSSRKNTRIWLQDAEEKMVCEFVRGSKSVGWNLIHMQKVEDAAGNAYSYSFVDGKWVYANPTPGAANAAKAGDIDQTMMYVVINEIDMLGGTVELYNMGDVAVDLKNLQLRWSRLKDDEADNRTVWEGTVGQKLEPGAFLLVKLDGSDEAKINLKDYVNRNIHFKLRDAVAADFAGAKLEWDDFKRGKKGSGWTGETLPTPVTGSFARIPDGSGLWYMVSNATPGKSNGTAVTGKLVPDVEQN